MTTDVLMLRASALADTIIACPLNRDELISLLRASYTGAIDDEIGSLATSIEISDRETSALTASLREVRDTRIQLERELATAHETGAVLSRELARLRAMLVAERAPDKPPLFDARLFLDGSPYRKADPVKPPPLECDGSGEFNAAVFVPRDDGQPEYRHARYACLGCSHCGHAREASA